MKTPVRQNLHTHTQYDDGKDSLMAMTEEAIARGFTVLGFSGHSPNHPLDSGSMDANGMEHYLKDFEAVKEKYEEQIDLYCGIELDSMTDLVISEDYFENAVTPSWFDYIIGSVHYVSIPETEKKEDSSSLAGQSIAIDESRETFDCLLNEGFGGNIYALAQAYYQSVQEMIQSRPIDIVGHIDLLSKYNEDERYFAFDDETILDMAMKAVEAGIKKDVIFEMNTGAISRGYRSLPYPHPVLFSRMVEKGAHFCINTDCHNKQALDQSMPLCLDLARAAGLKELYVLDNGFFMPVSLDAFADAKDISVSL